MHARYKPTIKTTGAVAHTKNIQIHVQNLKIMLKKTESVKKTT